MVITHKYYAKINSSYSPFTIICYSHRHATPGVPAVMDLHLAFIHAAAMNPDPWLLRREQMCSVIRDRIPWLEESEMGGVTNDDMEDDEGEPRSMANSGILRRLASAYDPQNSGLVRFVRLSVSLLCCNKPNMANLIALLTELEEKRQKAKADREAEERDWDALQAQKDKEVMPRERYQHTSTDTHSHIHDVGPAPFHEGTCRGVCCFCFSYLACNQNKSPRSLTTPAFTKKKTRSIARA